MKNSAEKAVFQLGGWSCVRDVPGIVQHAGEVGERGELLHQGGSRILGDPAHEIEGVPAAGGIPPQVVGVVLIAQSRVKGEKLVVLGLPERAALFLQRRGGGICLNGLGAEVCNGLFHRAVGLHLQVNAHKMEGIEQRVHPAQSSFGGEIDPIHASRPQISGEEEEILFLVQRRGEAVVGLTGQIAISKADQRHVPERVQIFTNASEVFQLCGGIPIHLGPVLLFFFFGGQVPDAAVQIVKIGSGFRRIRSALKGDKLQRNAHLIGGVLRPAQESGVGIGGVEGTKPSDLPHKLEGILWMKFLIDDAGGYHRVKLLQRPGHSKQLHGHYRQGASSPFV